MNFLKDCLFLLLATIVTIIIFTVVWITYILVSPFQAAAKTIECWNETLGDAKRRKMESEK